jgi:hypothetical protein
MFDTTQTAPTAIASVKMPYRAGWLIDPMSKQIR